MRIPLIAGIAANPERSLAYGAYGGVDVIDELCRQLRGQPGIYEKALMGALCAFDDPRVSAFCESVAAEHDNAEIIGMAVARLGDHPLLQQLLLSGQPARAVPAARVLRDKSLTLEQKIWVELWVGLPTPLEVTPDTLHLWLEALQGPLSRRAQRCLQAAGLPALELLLPHWESFPGGVRRWLAQWGLEQPQVAPEILRRALASPDLVDLALPRLSPEQAVLAQPFLTHPAPAIRAQAWLVAPLPDSALETLATEPAPKVRRAIALRLIRQPEPPLLQLAYHSDWRVRAVAAQGLIEAGQKSRESARELALAEQPETRAVGVRVLMALDDYEWMEENLL